MKAQLVMFQKRDQLIDPLEEINEVIGIYIDNAESLEQYLQRDTVIVTLKGGRLSDMKKFDDDLVNDVASFIRSNKESMIIKGATFRKHRVSGDRLDYYTILKGDVTKVIIPHYSYAIDAPMEDYSGLMGFDGKITTWPPESVTKLEE